MTLPDVAALKLYLKLEDSTAEDTLLASILAAAQAMCERFCERPLDTVRMTFVDPATTFVAYGRITALQVPVCPVHPGLAADPAADPPVAAILAPVVTDSDGDVVDPATYRIDSDTGRFIALAGSTFPTAPYTIEANVGLAALPNYARTVEPVLSQAILDTASDLYSNRTPSAASETAGGGASVQWRDPSPSGLPARARAMLEAYKPIGFA